MNPLIVMGAIVLLPTLLITVTKTKAALVFMALCVGSVLSNFVGDAAMDMVHTFVRGDAASAQSVVQLSLLLAPVVLTLLFLMKTARNAWLLNIFPAVLTGIMTLFLVVPLLPDGTMGSITNTATWSQLGQYQPLLIGAAALVSLAQLWATNRAPKDKKSKRK